MLSKTSLAFVIGMSSFLAAANPISVDKSEDKYKADVQYPPGMPSVCIPYYVPPKSCTSEIPTPSYPATSPSVPTQSSPSVSLPATLTSTTCHTSPGGGPPSSSGGTTPSVSTHSVPTSPVSPPSVSTPPVTTSVSKPSVPTSPVSVPSVSTPPVSTPPVSIPVTPSTSITPTTTLTVTHTPSATSISQCNTGNAQCCSQVQKASSASASNLLGLLGIVLEDLDVMVGIQCTSVAVIGGVLGTNCAQQPVCCENNQFNGLINIGCTPISL